MRSNPLRGSRMPSPLAKPGLTATPPAEAVRGPQNSLFLHMPGLGANPPAGRLLRGLTPYLDEQGAAHVFLFTERRRREPWSAHPEQVVPYQEVVHWARGEHGGVYRGVCVKGGGLKYEDVVQAFEYEPLSLLDWAARRTGAAVVGSDAPVLLEPCVVPKPWGREVWFSGIEKRGVSRVRSATGTTELPYALHMFPVPMVGEQELPPILLKALEPLPDPVYGDLYLEVHREKWEVYVVLDVDRTAWPDGRGSVRAGVDPDVVEAFRTRHGEHWEQALAEELRGRIEAYQQVRQTIDSRIDEVLREAGEDPEQPVAPERHRRLFETLPEELRAEEARLREAVEGMLGSQPLEPGDVVSFAPGTLHSLQHGVRVIEFQTPSYERLIAMFAQKVLTQAGWDTAEAVRLMSKHPYTPAAPEPVLAEGGITVDRVVNFPQFVVHRVSVELNRRFESHTHGGAAYQLIFTMAGKGEIALGGGRSYTLEPGQAYLVPAGLGIFEVHGIASQGVTLLQAEPRHVGAAGHEAETAVDDPMSMVW